MTNTTSELAVRSTGSAPLATGLGALEKAVWDTARTNITELTQGEAYTETEIAAMIDIEALRQVNGIDLYALLLREKIITKIEHDNAITRHPSGYHTLQDMARDQGISLAELSQTLDLVRIIFPWIQDNLGTPIYTVWESIGKSNFRELTPILKSIITGEPSATNSVRTSVDAILNDAAATAAAANLPTDPDSVRRQALETLIHDGEHLTNRELRNRVHRVHMPNIHASFVQRGNTNFLVATLDEDQRSFVTRQLGPHMDKVTVALPDDYRARQAEARRIPELRALIDMLGE